MKLRFFAIRALDADSSELDAFLASQRVLSVDTRLVDDGADSFWAVCVRFLEGAEGSKRPSGKRSPIDYRELLPPDVFARYARLRELRNRLAQEQNRPAYAIFTNEQLAKLAALSDPSAEALAAIEGVGPQRMEAFAAPFLALLEELHGAD